MAEYIFSNDLHIFLPKEKTPYFGYSDGDTAENYLLDSIKKTKDLSLRGRALSRYIIDWPSMYHFSELRANLLRPFEPFIKKRHILEIGCGCGAMTRYMGEIGASVTALEGSLRRASIASARCRDLDNVSVFCDNAENFNNEELYDVVTLIGVLEYSRIFISGENPPLEMLRLARSLLKPEGTLIIAIENRFGLKYFAGAPEDHLGTPYSGISDHYQRNTAVTFGRRQLERLLEVAGLGKPAFLFPFPDYKLPNVIITETGLKHPNTSEIVGNLLVQQSLRAQGRPYVGAFSEQSAWYGIVEEGIVDSVANSFLILASTNNQLPPVLKDNLEKVCAYIYSVNRRAEYAKETFIEKTVDEKLVVHKRRLYPDGLYEQASLTQNLEKEKYKHGQILFNSLPRLLSKDGWSVETIAKWAKPWIDYLFSRALSSAEIPIADHVLPVELWDCTPFNFLIDKNGEADCFDLEWLPDSPPLLSHVVLRGLFHTFKRIDYFTKSDIDINEHAVELSLQVAALFGLKFSQEKINKWLKSERDFIYMATGLDSDMVSPKLQLSPFSLMDWFKRHRWSDLAVARLTAYAAKLDSAIDIHILLIVDSGINSALADTLDAFAAQSLRTWRLTVFSPAACPDPLFETLPPLGWVNIAEIDLAEAVNTVVANSDSNWFLLGFSGLRVEPGFSALVCAEVAHHPEWRFVYLDEDRIDSDGQFKDPLFKPNANLDLLRSTCYVGHACLIHRELWELMVGEELKSILSFNYAAALYCYEVFGEKAIGHIDEIFFHQLDSVVDNSDQFERKGIDLIRQHLSRCNIAAEVDHGLVKGSFFVNYLVSYQPLVSIIIPTKNHLDLLQPCIESLLGKTHYCKFEVIIVDNDSKDSMVFGYLNYLAEHDKRVKILRYTQEYNYSAINNFAAQQAKGEFLVLLNNDTVILQENWLDRLVAIGLRDDVGAVGCRLVYADQNIQHAGVVLGLNGIAEHIGIGLPMTELGYLDRAQVTQNFSAVTAACMLVRKELFFEVEGLDEKDFAILYNDIDLCLKIGERGFRIVWTPFVTLVHHGGSSLKSEYDANREKKNRNSRRAFIKKWFHRLGNDPAYNRHLSLRQREWVIDNEFDVSWHPNFETLPRIVALPPYEMGVGQYRVIGPIKELTQSEQICSFLLPVLNSEKRFLPSVPELVRAKPTVLFLQNSFTDFHLEHLEEYAELLPDIFRVFGQDDIVFSVPQKSAVRKHFGKDTKARVRRGLSLCHRAVVTTEPIAEALRGMIADIRVVPNFLERSRWGDLQPSRGARHKPRVGWAGAQQHGGDLEFILPVVEATANEVDWVFMGMCPPKLRYHVAEAHPAVPFDQYPTALSALDLDLAIAPLELNRFNTAKSNLRLLEYGAVGYPVIATDILPYRNAPVTRVPNNPRAWINAIREHVHDLAATRVAGERLHEWVLSNWMLDQHLDEWLRALLPD
ncbi:MAG: glycosyltransferase [Candidatus Competibacteraceae bacterium]|nr:glycosyltransferase [Candidatus Competibacteraceae bacterium]